MENKEILWSVLIKYDGINSLTAFCDSISKFIQGNENGTDIINVFNKLTSIDISDKNKIDKTIGEKIDYFLFSV